MSYDLAVWKGPRPESNETASREYEQLMDLLETGDVAPPIPEIAEFVQALLQRWPDIDDDAGEDSPWADGPPIGNAFGNAIYFAMVWGRADAASEFAANVAEGRGFVCYDPQLEQLRPIKASGPQRGERRSWSRRSS